MLITNDIKYVGVTDNDIDLFEGQYEVNGMLYNSYVILDEKVCVVDTVDVHFKDEWLNNLENVLNGRLPDYLVIHHMEPDHSANIKVFLEKYANCKVVSSVGAFNMMKNLFGTDFTDRKIVVKEKDTLELGKHTLSFVAAPLVHWPEVIMSYDSYDKVLFSADGFGKFGKEKTIDNWLDEARRYYIGIVGKFGVNVQNVLKKAASLDIEKICSTHGPVLTENLGYYLNYYDKWSKYEAEEEGVCICYSSVYGHTKEAILNLSSFLKARNIKHEIFDLARDSQSEALAKAFKYDKLVLATTTYNNSIFPVMDTFISSLLAHNYQNRKIALIENGLWAPQAVKVMTSLLEPLKDITYLNSITIKGSLSNDVLFSLEQLSENLI